MTTKNWNETIKYADPISGKIYSFEINPYGRPFLRNLDGTFYRMLEMPDVEFPNNRKYDC